MDERMMNLLSLIADQVRNTQDLFNDEGKIMSVLMNSGYHLHEVDAALTLMQTLSQNETEGVPAKERRGALAPVRAMSTEERSRFTIDAFGFITKLARLGVISEDLREDLLERAMSMYTGRIDIGLVKPLVAFDLFSHAQDQEEPGDARLRRVKGTAWN